MDIVVIPDTQVKAGVNTDHIEAAGNYIALNKPEVIVVIGDWWDMASLCKYKSKREMENSRIVTDLQEGVKALDRLLAPISNDIMKTYYTPRKVFCIGNHDPQVRIQRLYDEYPQLEGMLAVPILEDWGFEVYNFLEVATIGGIRFSHFFQNMYSPKKAPLSGTIENMIKTAGFSFVQGHSQGLKMGKAYLGDGSKRIGIVAGSFYSHKEGFMGEQGNNHWQGIIHLRDVVDGHASIQEIPLEYLVKNFLC